MKLVRGVVWLLFFGLTMLLVTVLFTYLLYSELSGGAGTISPTTFAQISSNSSPRWPFVVVGVFAVALGLYVSVSSLRYFAEETGLIPLDALLLEPHRNPFARRVATVVLSNDGLLFPGFGGQDAAGGVSRVVEFHGDVEDSGVRTALKELQSRLKSSRRFSRRPVLVLQVVPVANEQVSAEVSNWITSCALSVGFSSVRTLTGLERALTHDEFSRMARVLS